MNKLKIMAKLFNGIQINPTGSIPYPEDMKDKLDTEYEISANLSVNLPFFDAGANASRGSSLQLQNEYAKGIGLTI